MRFRRYDSSLHKTLAFAVIHVAIAITVGWFLTGGFILGSVLALIEPTTNTFVSHALEKLSFRRVTDPRRHALLRSALLGVSHLVVAMGVGFLLSGSWLVASAYALIEPAANAVAHYFFDRWWQRRRAQAARAPVAFHAAPRLLPLQ